MGDKARKIFFGQASCFLTAGQGILRLMDETLKIDLYHDAGHAVACYVLRGRFDAEEMSGPIMAGVGELPILLFSSAQLALYQRFAADAWRSEIDSLRSEPGLLARLQDYMVIAWAGECTEGEFGFPCDLQAQQADHEFLTQMRDVIMTVWPEEAKGDFLTPLFRRCEELVHTHRHLIEGLVETILRDGRREVGESYQFERDQIIQALA